MNTKKIVIYFLFVISLTLAFSTCVNNFMDGDEGIVTINFGGSSANISFNDNTESRTAI